MSELLTQSSTLIAGPAGSLEVAGSLGRETGPYYQSGAVAVVCHPHPLHGGTMNNKVVTTLARTYRDLGVGVLRFNFRGVGRSGGEHDHARGEVDDAVAVASALLQERPKAPLLLAGFSFGASVAAQASYRLPCRHLTLVAPPVPRYAFEQGGRFAAPVTVLQGDRDERVDELTVEAWAGQLAGSVVYRCFDEAGHFFHGRLTELKQSMAETLLEQLPSEALL
ncbi:alpha/beta fold hydrolase [Gilvimarinus agarilyticus]|uniref:alpha/beta hydrolase n=1 Tax=Gilvimarinus sp. 2_MG-2023 TaxID=3062666 RepID=UPI001C09A4FB|nr:alpha/beta fold hydrolase [Gilvimarinus sp. 2_MG-2023]MBU2887639.1 alpha/beta fold hydrolase [Gilvimarinus agarilyticus]MDO6572290.1 alpha/beta fold hydrolase [Gilvimarinus sp. 2_MG-2023]